MNLQKVSMVRSRGQLTIPDQIRKAAKWLSTDSVVSVSMVKQDEVILKPHKPKYDWEKIWKGIRKSRAVKGRGAMSAAEFLEKDRQSH
ncbi:hypothetical protein A2803_03415 [Candidatus Woesebacteria bacterium RIFCSPHIGHO2_01_FULL_44_21]|uniref:SpoVT-AbrB domain-containing protein n=1 Tax=Candidatus Woesebacteria bacterium RIFCSPHIGHO2_01_FULL_44_21 TaxID=1802503 RepID=A0A1F7YZ40_9BACT|nr:MAG: hypothetical protein A2803_03415 [Candidatus Woesebacteria bacterium RIFCSPHIGHO2_01_FULL_44_21]OGM69120.1 MAG: hypothetical protein A2897_04825 [Candidatus Woesebacteria bacterium RIFCSPLOWO2_01_FULL_44_24b]